MPFVDPRKDAPIAESAASINKIGNTVVEVSRLGVGGSPFGGSCGREISETQSNVTLRWAATVGLRYFDTAPHYGAGLGEERLGVVLSTLPRESFTISTKVGKTLVPRNSNEPRGPYDFASDKPLKSIADFSRNGAQRSIEGSLERLKLDRIDIVYIHDPDDGILMIDPAADPRSTSHFKQVMDEVYPYLAELRSQGALGAIGVGINQAPMLCDFAAAGDFDVFLIAHFMTLLDHDVAFRELVPLCKAKNISLIAASLFHNGILVSGATPDDGTAPFYNSGPAPAEIVARVQRIESICTEFNVPLAAAALQFPFFAPTTASALVGMRNPTEILKNSDWLAREIPLEFWRALGAAQLISPEALQYIGASNQP